MELVHLVCGEPGEVWYRSTAQRKGCGELRIQPEGSIQTLTVWSWKKGVRGKGWTEARSNYIYILTGKV